MPTPSSRTPVRIARGTYSNLNSSVSDIQEGEIVYATDQDKLYVKEGSSLVSTQANLTNYAQDSDIGVTIQAYDADNAVTDATQTFTAGQRGEITTLTNSSGTVAINFNDSNNFYLSLGANVTTITFSNITAGQSGSIFINQTGTYTVGGWPGTAKFSGGTAPTITATAGKYDRIDYAVYDGSNVHLVWTGNY